MKNNKIYQEGIIVCGGLLLAGLLIEFVNGGIGVPQVKAPFNYIILFIHILLSTSLITVFRSSLLTQWLTKIPTSMVSMFGFLIVCSILGVIPQIDTSNYWINSFRMNNVTTSWYFTFMIIWMLTCLLLISLKRIKNGIIKNWGFILNHFGLYLSVVAAFFGSADIEKVILEVDENRLNWVAKDEITKQQVDLPFAIYLDDFILEEYLPKISVYDNRTEDLVTNHGKTIIEAKEGAEFEINGILFKVIKYIPFAIKFGDEFKQVYQYGATPAVLIESEGKQFWIASGTYNFSSLNHNLNEHESLILTFPEPKKYQSNIKIIDRDGIETKVSLSVNESYKYDDWKIYQLGFDDDKGRWSEKSSFELIKDPWLPFVYVGIFMMIIGAIHMIWRGNLNKNINK